MVIPFVDMTVKGFLWYQGENNMGGVKGNSAAKLGYACEQRLLIDGWRHIWSRVPNTTEPLAPFGVVTLASSGSEGGPNMGAMRQAQTASYGVLPNPVLPNTFVVQAYDLDDPWGPSAGPCFKEWLCCPFESRNETVCNNYTRHNPGLCDPACVAAETPVAMGGIHPRDKKPVGDRLGTAAFNTVYGGSKAFTGPTISSCEVQGTSLVISFNSTLLRGDSVVLQPYLKNETLSMLQVQTDPDAFCMEPLKENGTAFCPSWAGGTSHSNSSVLGQGWVSLNISLPSTNSDVTNVVADLSPLNGTQPSSVRYAWGIINCCADPEDPMLYITKPCGPAACPIMSSSNLPANPFMARIENGKCVCVPPQEC
eukprot:m.59131 g.59131  ORF g.59131 m.59131 type:complete len:367 (+) comp19074_c0_seq1:1277-2377(+)